MRGRPGRPRDVPLRGAAAAYTLLPEVVEWDGDGVRPAGHARSRRQAGSPSRPGPPATERLLRRVGPGPYFDVGNRDAVPFSFPDKGWEFEATFREAGEEKCRGRSPCRCARPAPGPGWSSRSGRPATGTSTCSGAAKRRRDHHLPLVHRRRLGSCPGRPPALPACWPTTTTRSTATASRSASATSPTQPKHATAEVTVTSADGRSVTIPPQAEPALLRRGLAVVPGIRRRRAAARPSSATARSPTRQARLDGKTYTVSASGRPARPRTIAPHVPLTWTPALPAYVTWMVRAT